MASRWRWWPCFYYNNIRCVANYKVGGGRVHRIADQQRLFIPLLHRPGEEAQVDFFEVAVEEAQIPRITWRSASHILFVVSNGRSDDPRDHGGRRAQDNEPSS